MVTTPTLEPAAPPYARISGARRWAMLAVGTTAQATSAAVVLAPAFLIPVLHEERGMSLAEAGLVAAAPTVGMTLTLVLWGLVVDRRGERFSLLAGLSLVALGGAIATRLDDVVALAAALTLAGVGAASTNSASGRVVVGWFPPARRGLAMGIRQTAQPLGVALGALTVPVLAETRGIGSALAALVVATVVAGVLVAVVVLDPPRPAVGAGGVAAHPYRADGYLARVHGASVLLVVPQFLIWTFSLTWLVTELDWSPAAAGLVVAATQVGGAAARIGSGWVSDRVGSRMKPMRAIAAIAAAAMAALGGFATLDGGLWVALAVAMLVVASAVTVADNGLAFTAVAERAGPFWSGRALGMQNTAQHVAAAAVPPLAGLAIAQWGYGVAFTLAALAPLLAIPVVPVGGERTID